MDGAGFDDPAPRQRPRHRPPWFARLLLALWGFPASMSIAFLVVTLADLAKGPAGPGGGCAMGVFAALVGFAVFGAPWLIWLIVYGIDGPD
jgi:hypothetical protein